MTEHPASMCIASSSARSASRDALTLEVVSATAIACWPGARRRFPPLEPATEPAAYTVHLDNLGAIKLWDLKPPNLYHVEVRLLRGTQAVDEDSRRIGFREAQFTDHGFELNGKVVKLRGLDRHQTFPFVGQAMPGRVQRRDADILRNKLKCNIVRTSHYPQSRHFLDACDEIGLLVLEEIPGWQHIGDEPWKLICGRQRRPHDPPRLEPSLHHSVGRAHQRVAGRPRLLHAHQRAGPSSSIRRARPAASAISRNRSFSKTSSP